MKVTNENVVAVITKAMGARLISLQRDMDAYQNFWLAVLEAIPNADDERDMVPYLIRKGYGAVMHGRRKESKHEYVAYCPKCGEYFYFGNDRCPKCKGSLKYLNRKDGVSYGEEEEVRSCAHILESHDPDVDMLLTIRQFVDQLPKSDRYVAKRWLIDRADLMYDNYQMQLAKEVGITQTGIARRVMKIKRLFQVWYHQ